MRQTGNRGDAARVGVFGAMLVAIVLFGTMLVPSLASAIVQGATATKAALAPVNTAPPTLTGTPAPGQTLSCSTGTWANSPTSFTYTWLRSGAPIAGQSASTYVVQVADQGHAISCQVTAGNGGGNYTISGLASGSYKVEFSSQFETGGNYIYQFFNGKNAYSEATPVSVTAPAATGGINAALNTGGEITGRVTSATTHGAIGEVFVCADEVVAELYGNCAVTNSNGEYTLTSLGSGTYKVNFNTYSPGSNYLPAEDNPVSVTAGSVTPNINAELQPGAQITGRVTNASKHEAIAKVEVCAFEAAGSPFDRGCTSTDAEGKYAITGLVGGEYKVEFYAGFESGNYLPQYWNGKSSLASADSVTVPASGATENINAQLQPGGQIQGKVTSASGGGALANISVCAIELGGEKYYGGCVTTNAEGAYTLSSLPSGEYEVEFYPGYEGGNYLRQYWENKSSSTEATGVKVTSPATTPAINAALQPGGQIAGKVTGAPAHAPVAKVDVCASQSSFDACATTNAAGEYVISGLPSGSYTVSFYTYEEDGIYLPQYYSGKAASSEANPVAVSAPSATPNINAELQVGAQISGRVTDAHTLAGLSKIEVCAEPVGEGGLGRCTETTGGASSASAGSNALAIPGGSFTLAKVSFNSKTNDLDFFFSFPSAGKLTWSLFFRNADVGFADSLGLSPPANGLSADVSSARPVAEAARKHRKSKGCKRGTIKHHGKCVHVLVPFGSGSQSVAAGNVEVKVHASAKAIRALKSGRTLHVSGTFTFQSALGGPAISKVESALVRPAKKHGKGHRKGKRH